MTKSLLLILITLELGAAATKAQVNTYFSQVDFDPATVDDTSYNIPAPSPSDTQMVGSSYTVDPLTFLVNADTGTLYLVNDGAYGVGQTYIDALSDDAAAASETITLAGATALAFNLGTYQAADTVTVDVNGVQAAVIDTTDGYPASSFFGVTSTTPITSLTFSLASGDEFDILNFEVGSAVPEPSSWELALGGLGLLAGGRFLLRTRAA